MDVHSRQAAAIGSGFIGRFLALPTRRTGKVLTKEGYDGLVEALVESDAIEPRPVLANLGWRLRRAGGQE